MQIKPEPQQVLNLINDSHHICLITDASATADSVSAMLAFHHLFKKFKEIRLVVPEEVPTSCHQLPESSIIEKDLGPKNLLINFDTNGVAIDKVTYFLAGKTFKMVLHPKTRSFNVDRVSYEYQGFNFDLFVFFGVAKLANLGPLFNYDFGEISAQPSINFDIHKDNEMFGLINSVDSYASSICEMFFKMIGSWQLNFDHEVSLCLLNGLASSQSSTPGNLNDSFHRNPEAVPGSREVSFVVN